MELRRQAARVVVIDEARRVLLQQARDPFHTSKPPWWEIPGGGIDRGETSEQAAARELFEETGIRDVELGPVVWRQRSKFTFAGWHFDQDEHIHVAWLRGPAPEWNPQHLELLERHAFLGIRWWDVDDLLASDEPTVPPRLREFLPALARGDVPESPLDIGVPIA